MILKTPSELTYYEVLNISAEADAKQIYSAYLQAVSTYEQDSLAVYGLLDEMERCKHLELIEEAFQCLKDPEQREAYDDRLNDDPEPVETDAGSIPLSSGRYLRQVRESKQLSLQDLSRQTCIRTHYLSALETESYEDLPAGAYVRFLLGSYAASLGLDSGEVIEDFRRRQDTPAEK